MEDRSQMTRQRIWKSKDTEHRRQWQKTTNTIMKDLGSTCIAEITQRSHRRRWSKKLMTWIKQLRLNDTEQQKDIISIWRTICRLDKIPPQFTLSATTRQSRINKEKPSKQLNKPSFLVSTNTTCLFGGLSGTSNRWRLAFNRSIFYSRQPRPEWQPVIDKY